MTHLSGTRALSHLLSAVLAELDFYLALLQYFGKANVDEDKTIRLAAHNECPISGICRWLDLAFGRRQGRSIRYIGGVSEEIWMSVTKSPHASERRMPVSLIMPINERVLSSSFWQSSLTRSIVLDGVGTRARLAPSSGMKAPLEILLVARPVSRIAKLTMARTNENTLSNG